MRWDTTLLNRARSAFVRMPVDRTTLRTGRPGVEAEGRRILRHMLEPLRIDDQDIEVLDVDPDEATWSDVLIFRWRPTVTTVEVVGHEQADGQTFEYGGAPHGEPVTIIPSPLAPAYSFSDEPHPTVTTIDNKATLARVGWDEDERHWIYA